MKNHYGCPVKATSNVIAGKWKVLIVWHLSFGSHRFAELRNLLPGVSEKVTCCAVATVRARWGGPADRRQNFAAAGRLPVNRLWKGFDPVAAGDVRLGFPTLRTETESPPHGRGSELAPAPNGDIAHTGN